MSISKLLWSIAAVTLASNAHASLIQVVIVAGPSQHPDGTHDTWRVIAVFDNENDKLLGVNGFSLCFFAGGGELYNQALFGGLPANDFPSVSLGGEAYDSYVTTGATDFPHHTGFTKDWVGAIAGSEFCRVGGWFYGGDPPPVIDFDSIPDNKTFDVVVAQFTVDEGVGFHLEGNIVWQLDKGENSTPFVVDNIMALCPWDLDLNDFVGTSDLLELFAQWGTAGSADFDEDGTVGTSDLLILFANWGPCP